MAAGTKLVLTFENASGSSVSMSYNYADSSADVADVKALVNGIIANGSIFVNVPVTAKGAKRVTTTETEYDLSA